MKTNVYSFNHAFFKSDYLDDSGFASRNLICVHTNTPEKVNTMGYDQALS